MAGREFACFVSKKFHLAVLLAAEKRNDDMVESRNTDFQLYIATQGVGSPYQVSIFV